PLKIVRAVMWPVSAAMSRLILLFSRGGKSRQTGDDEIKLLAEKGAADGLISAQEKDLISNALSLDDTLISEIMTPRTVVVALDESESVGGLFARLNNIPFGRMPVYKDTVDNIVGIVRRRDLLTAKAKDEDFKLVKDFVKECAFVPENGSSLAVMRQLLRRHQQMGIVVDEFGSLTGVVTLEDIFEHLLGSEIFEADDVAVDMRELALKRKKMMSKRG
ncbi:MAG: CBS domain-containing protein, partial [Opitutales bacterium]|nr:CBS domain-containing protein [Opitutales bacterium]